MTCGPGEPVKVREGESICCPVLYPKTHELNIVEQERKGEEPFLVPPTKISIPSCSSHVGESVGHGL